MGDNAAVLEGYTREVVASYGADTLYLLVKPDAELGDTFKAWDMDAQCWVRVNGWLATFE